MAELIFIFNDPNEGRREVTVAAEKFIIGRSPECNLPIADTRLSREHLLVERYGDVFVATDRGSSNGTLLNGSPLTEPKAINDRDRLDLGGFEIKVAIGGGQPEAAAPSTPEPAIDAVPAPAPIRPSAAVTAPAAGGGLPRSVFIAVPIIAVVVLVALGALVYSMSGKKTVVDNSNFIYSSDPERTPSDRKSPTPSPGSSASPAGTDTPPGGTDSGDSGNVATPPPTPSNLNDAGKTEANAAAFLRKAAANDPKAFVTGTQAQIISAKVKTAASSPALADNISSARKNAAAINSLATSKNLKPQLLAAAAIAKLGSSRGDVLSTAQSMADTLDKLAIQVGNELGDDCLLMMAAYDQGDPMKMRNMLQNLATQSTESSRTIRSIWFLHKNGKITAAEYDFALRFLAVGTIAQNPRDFGVNTDGLSF